MNDDLILACVRCAETADAQRHLAERQRGFLLRWPEHCGEPMRLANTTDRDGNAIERAKAAHPSAGEHRYGSELP